MDSTFNLKTREMLKKAGIYRTKCRMAVVEALSNANEPLSQVQIAQRLGKNSPDKVTIYRTLESLCRNGLVHRLFAYNGIWHFELAHNCKEKQCHPHFICKNCGKTFCLIGLFLPLIKGLKKGFVVHRQQVRIEGLCSSCS